MHYLLNAADPTSKRLSFAEQLFANQTINPVTWPQIVFGILLAFGVGLFIFWVYRMTYRGVMYSSTFGMTLILMTLITTPVVMCIRDSIALSMGMVGALSIVRFRTAVKDPLDIAYLFWSMTMGILIGAGQFFMAALAVVVIAALIVVLTRLKFQQVNCYLLVIHYDPDAEGAIQQVLRGVRTQRIKSKTLSRGGAEMTVELRIDKQGALLNKLLATEGVENATLVAYQPE